MTSIIDLLNFFLIYNFVNKKQYNTVIFLIILRSLYIKNQYELFLLNNNNNINIDPYEFKILNNETSFPIKNESIPFNSGDKNDKNTNIIEEFEKSYLDSLGANKFNINSLMRFLFSFSCTEPNYYKLVFIVIFCNISIRAYVDYLMHLKNPDTYVPNYEYVFDLNELEENHVNPEPNTTIVYKKNADGIIEFKTEMSTTSESVFSSTSDYNIKDLNSFSNLENNNDLDSIDLIKYNTTREAATEIHLPDANTKSKLDENIFSLDNILVNPKPNIRNSNIKSYKKKSFSDYNRVSYIKSTIQQIPISTQHLSINKNNYTSEDATYIDCNILNSSNDSTINVPILISSCDITNIFKGELIFVRPITDVNIISNVVYITSSTLIIDETIHTGKGLLFLDGYLKTSLDSSELFSYSCNTLTSTYKNHVICTPFSLTTFVELGVTFNVNQISFNNLEISLLSMKSDTKRILHNCTNLNMYTKIYEKCELIIEMNYKINIYKEDYLCI